MLVALFVVAGGVLPASPALAVLDQPSRVSRSFEVQTVFGTCHVGASTTATTAVTRTGRVATSQSVDCQALSGAPASIVLVSNLSSLTAADAVNGPAVGERFCFSEKWCTLLHARNLLLPGDYTARFRIALDLVQGSGSQTYYLGHPSDCRVSSIRTDDLLCEFSQTVTWKPTAP